VSAVPLTFTCTAAAGAGSFCPCIDTSTRAALIRVRSSRLLSRASIDIASGRRDMTSSRITQPFRTAAPISRRSWPGVRGSTWAAAGKAGATGTNGEPAPPPNPPVSGRLFAGLIIPHRLSSCQCLPSLHDHVAILRADLHAVALAAQLFGCDERGAAATERLVDIAIP